MDYDVGPVVYLDNRAQRELVVDKSMLAHVDVATAQEAPQNHVEGLPSQWFNLPLTLRKNVLTLLNVFPSVTLCHSANSCSAYLDELLSSLNHSEPITVIVDILEDEAREIAKSATLLDQNVHTKFSHSVNSGERGKLPELYGLQFIEHLEGSINDQSLSDLLILAAAVRNSRFSKNAGETNGENGLLEITPDLQRQILDSGAVDVLPGDFPSGHIHSLASYAYRISRGSTQHSSAQARKQRRSRSWVGISESRPYSYLRERMVSGLMARICNPDYKEDPIDIAEFEIADDRKQAVASVIGSWEFSAHDFNDDELMYGSLLMLEHTLKLEELAKWRMPTDQLLTFLVACRRVYNDFVLYHNFRHACDVMQATFHFLIRIGVIPPFPSDMDVAPPAKSALASLLEPFHALTLVISAIGHDVGHPGVNNAFLVTLNAPLAQLYNDRSVLEAFHCAAFSQILRRYWPVAFSDIAMRKLMITSILATDMGLHGTYMTQMGNLHEKFAHNNYVVDGWNVQTMEEYKDLLCCLLIKCADICNVARKLDCANEWTRIVTSEFAHQGQMEIDLHIPTCLFGGPPDLNDSVKITNGQIGFLNIFASPLFEGVSEILPHMHFCVKELESNRQSYQESVSRETKRRSRAFQSTDGAASPRTSRSISDFHQHKDEVHQSPLAHSDSIPPGDDESPATPIVAHKSPPEGGSVGPASQPVYDTSRRASLGTTAPENSSPEESRRGSIKEI